mgnify:FL=1|jgi:hypothetical protein
MKKKRKCAKKKENQKRKNSNFSKKKEATYETPEQKEKRIESEKRTRNFLIGIGTAFMFYILFEIGGGNGYHVPVAMFFMFWTIRQIFVVLMSFVPD